jgi:hypothetical protein
MRELVRLQHLPINRSQQEEIAMPKKNEPSLTQDARRAAIAELTRQLGKPPHLGKPGTLVRDVDGKPLFMRLPLKVATPNALGDLKSGFADVTWIEALGSPLLTFSLGFDWDEKQIIAAAEKVVDKAGGKVSSDVPQFVAYHFPHVGVRFTLQEGGTILLDAARPEDPIATGGLDHLGVRIASDLSAPLLSSLEGISKPNTELFRAQVGASQKSAGQPAAAAVAAIAQPAEEKSKEARSIIDDFPFRKQLNEVWCVPACIQMMLAYYHYDYRQADIAKQLGLGTDRPEELDATRAFEVVRAIKLLSSNALDVEMNIFFGSLWDRIKKEICKKRPAVLLGGGHARVIIGYSEMPNPGTFPTRSLLFVDPDRPYSYVQAISINLLNFDLVFFARLPKVKVAVAAPQPDAGAESGLDGRDAAPPPGKPEEVPLVMTPIPPDKVPLAGPPPPALVRNEARA